MDQELLSSNRLDQPPSMPEREPTHGDILEKLGELKGSLNALTLVMAQKREDINSLFDRVGIVEQNAAKRDELSKIEATARVDLASIEKRVMLMELTAAKWAGICLAVAFSSPFVVPRIERMFTPAPPVHAAPRAP
jgi:hypothetical protein